MDKGLSTVSAIIAGILGLAIVAVIVSQHAATSSVVGSAGSALANIISAAVSPVTGNSVAPNVGSGGGGGGGGLGGILGNGSGFDPTSLLRGFNPMSLMGGSSFGAGML